MDVAAMSIHNPGIRKAAILVAGLDSSAADALLDRLDPEQADAVRRAVMELEEVNAEERRRVIDEFRRVRPMVPDASPAGIELNRLPAGSTPFRFLCETEDGKLSQLLSEERPATVALVLAHLPAERAGEVLSRLATPLQIEVVRRMADLDGMDPETVREVEQALEAQLSRQFAAERRREAGPQAVAKILASCDRETRAKILDNLAAEDSTLAERFGRRSLDFAELVRLDDAALSVVFHAADADVMQAALLGASPALVERFLGCLPAAESRRLRRNLAHPDPIRLSDVEEAQRQVAAAARRELDHIMEKSAA